MSEIMPDARHAIKLIALFLGMLWFPASATAQQELVGAFADSAGEYIVVAPVGSGPRQMLMLASTRTEQLRLLFPAAGDTFGTGHFIAQPKPVEHTVVFTRAAGRVSGITLIRRNGTPRSFPRIRLTSQEVEIDAADVTLRGTLLMRSGATGLRPAIVFAHGSENSNRHSFGPLPYVLAAHGYTVLIYDKRGTGASTGSWQNIGIEPLAQDLAAALGFLAQRANIDSKRMGVIGTSEGGWVIANALQHTARISAVIALSGGGLTKGDAYIHKMTQLAKEQKLEGTRLDSAVAAARSTVFESNNRVARDSSTATGFDRRISYNPGDDWKRLRAPFLYLGGEVDVLEPSRQAAAWLDDLFRATNHKDYTIKLFPQGHHSLLRAVHGTPTEFSTLNGVSELVPGYWSTLLRWLDVRLNFRG